jgi:signal transduction histidine kinase
MNSATRFRLAELLAAALLVIAALVWAERMAWRQITTLRKEMNVRELERFRSADELRATILQWQNSLAAPDVLEVGHVQELIQTKLRHASSTQEQELIRAIAAAFDQFSVAVSQPESRASRNRLFGLLEDLSESNRANAEQFITDANAALTRLQRFLFVSLLGLLICGAAVVALIYRRTITSLRTNLTESRAIIERQEKLASLGVLATGIAHEIRNPLTAIKVRLFTLKASHATGSSEREDLEVIRDEIDRLERIVRDFLQFARPAEPELKVLPVEKLLRAAHDLLQSPLAEKGIELKLELETNDLISVDPDKLKQVLINFIQNGADSMEAGGVVMLRSRADEQMLKGKLTHVVVIEIADRGKGIPPEVQKRLFDPFFTTKEKGTGLGLPIAARIVEKHGGVIQYRTQPNRGTTFSIVLPAAASHEIESQSVIDRG